MTHAAALTTRALRWSLPNAPVVLGPDNQFAMPPLELADGLGRRLFVSDLYVSRGSQAV